MKKLLLLGGLRYLIPVIKKAKELGYYVITCDNVEDNIAHKHSDEYHNVSIIDKEAVLALAQKLQIDGIMSFAVDPGVVTAAYVADKMGLSYPPYKSVIILQNKGLFRQFLKDNNFNVPLAQSFVDKNLAINSINNFVFPVIVKPVDSAGSKGVTKVESVEQLSNAIDIAIKYSFTNEFIIEEFIELLGYSTDCDSFSIENDLVVCTFNNQYFNKNASNPYTPAGYSWPSSMSSEAQNKLKIEIQRLINLLDMGTSIYNIETRVSANGTPYIMEMSPRGGGNRLSEIVKLVYGVDLIEMAVRNAMGEKLVKENYKPNDVQLPFAELVLHSNKTGLYSGIDISKEIKDKIVELDMWVKEGDMINSFNGANDTIGTMILKDIVVFDIFMTTNNIFYTIKLSQL